jgi:putative flippase GtrA
MNRLPLTELARFVIAGGLTNVVYFGVLYLTARVAAWPLWLASGVSYGLSMMVSYLLQRHLTFRSDRPHGEAGIRYVCVQLIGLALNSLLLALLVTRLSLHFVIGQAVALVVTTAWGYVAQKLWVFKHAPRVVEVPPA